MKALRLFLITFFAFSLSLNVLANETAHYTITEGKFHKGGKASVEVMGASPENYIVKLTYELYKKILVPIPSDELKGESIMEFPAEFRDERGYMELETKGSMELPKATIKFVKKLKYKNLENAYQILVFPKNGKSKIDIIYHPSIKSAGWAKVFVTFLSSNAILNGYELNILLNETK